MTLVGTGAAADTDIHEYFKGPKFIQSFLDTLMDNLLPVVRQFPVVVKRVPLPCIGQLGL